MENKELRALSDAELTRKIEDLTTEARQRDAQGGITPEAGKAVAALVPYRKEQERRAELKKRAELDKTTAKIADQRKAEQDRTILARKIYGREIL